MRRTLALLATLLTAVPLAIASGPGVALAKKRVVLLPFSGSKASLVRSRFARAIKRRVRLIPYKKYRRTARRLKVKPRSARGMRAVCAKLRCHAVVSGKVKRRGTRYRVSVAVYDARNGKAIGRRSGKTRGTRRLKRLGASMGRLSLRLIKKGRLPPRGAAQPPPEEEPPEPPPVVAAAPPPEPPPEEQDEVPPLVARELTTDDEEDADSGPLRGIFDVYASFGMSARTFSLKGADPAQDREYSGGLYPEFTLGGEIYPLAFFMNNFASYIGLALAYTRHIAVSTDLPDNPSRPATCEFDEQVDTGSQQLLADLKLRWPIQAWWKPVVSATVGYGMRDFELGPNDVLPSFAYQFVRLGLAGRLPFGTPLIGLEAGADFRMLMKVGQDAVDSLGSRSGGMGWAFFGGLRGDLDIGMFYFAGFEYQGYSVDFNGLNPADTPIRECEPDREDATSGTDGFMRFWLGLGYGM